MRMSRALGLAGGMVFAIAAATVAPASAVPIVNDHFHVSDSETFIDFCGDMAVLFEEESDVHELVKTRGPDGLVYFAANVRFVGTWTNLATGKTFTIESTFLDKDQLVTDNGDGTLTIVIMSPGQQQVYGPDGERLFLDAGVFAFAILVDHGGTPTDPSDDEFIEDLGLVKSAGRADTAGRDFCEDFRQFTS
jgi:hypothetical protein